MSYYNYYIHSYGYYKRLPQTLWWRRRVSIMRKRPAIGHSSFSNYRYFMATITYLPIYTVIGLDVDSIGTRNYPAIGVAVRSGWSPDFLPLLLRTRLLFIFFFTYFLFTSSRSLRNR